MKNYDNYLSDLKYMTKNYEDYRGLMLLPGALLLWVLGAKLMFANFDPTITDNPSLFDASGNFYWDTASLIASISIVLIAVFHYWYKAKIGTRAAKQKQKNQEILIAIVSLIVFLLSVILDYQFKSLFSFIGLSLCGIWLIGFFKHPHLKKLYSVNLFIQVLALFAGPLLFSELRTDSLNYQRHILGLCMVTAGTLLIITGLTLHAHLIKYLKKIRAQS